MDHGVIEVFPTRRIKPFDGMAVTAGVWGEAHDYHRRRLAAHELLWHGAGIVAGLEVVASDPPDSAVYISQGVALYAPGTGPGTGKRAVVEVGFHSLRHSFVSICRESDVPLAVVE